LMNAASCSFCAPNTWISYREPCILNACSKGFINSTLTRTCEACPGGKRQSGNNRKSCLRALSVSCGATGNECISCSAGSFSRANSSECSPCPPGTWSPGSSPECIPCAVRCALPRSKQLLPQPLVTSFAAQTHLPPQAGSHAPSPSSSSCAPCPIGSVSAQSHTVCVACAAGESCMYSSASARHTLQRLYRIRFPRLVAGISVPSLRGR
jgi:hypothetical protein